jgi:hypothetical protein
MLFKNQTSGFPCTHSCKVATDSLMVFFYCYKFVFMDDKLFRCMAL